MRKRGSLASQLQPRVTVTVAVMAVLVCLVSVLAAQSILMGQLDTELDGAQVRQDRYGQGQGPGPGMGRPDQSDQLVPGIDTPGNRVGTVIAVQVSETTGAARIVGEGEYTEVPLAALRTMLDVPADGNKRTVELEGMGRYRVEARETRFGKVTVGLPTDRVERALLLIGLLTAGAGVLAIAGTAFATRKIVQRATTPLVALTNTAADVAQLDLARGSVAVPRVPSGNLPEENEVTRLSAVFNDMLERVEDAIAEREASENKLRRFVADASHELRNPLAAIRGYAELAGRGETQVAGVAGAPGADGDAVVEHALERIGAESQRMTKLVNDLLLLARLDSDSRVDLVPVDAVEVVLNAVSDAQASSRNHEWRLQLPDEPVEVMADADRLQQVMVNLLSNARTHTPSGTTVTTSVSVEAPPPGAVRPVSMEGQAPVMPEKVAVIRVSDNGHGIPPEVLPHVFERFARADGARTHSAGNSTGLGLAIVKAVVEGFGGSAWVASVPGRTTFTIALPLAN